MIPLIKGSDIRLKQPTIIEVKGELQVKQDKDIGLALLPTKEVCIRIRVPIQYLGEEKIWVNMERQKDIICPKMDITYKTYGWTVIKEKYHKWILGYARMREAEGLKLISKSGHEEPEADRKGYTIFYDELDATRAEDRPKQSVRWIRREVGEEMDKYLARVRKQAQEEKEKPEWMEDQPPAITWRRNGGSDLGLVGLEMIGGTDTYLCY